MSPDFNYHLTRLLWPCGAIVDPGNKGWSKWTELSTPPLLRIRLGVILSIASSINALLDGSTPMFLKKTFLVLLIGFSSLSQVHSEPLHDPKIGALLPLSGPFLKIGSLVSEGVRGGIKSGVKLLVEDENCNSAQAVTAFKSLYAQGVRLFLGPCCGSPQAAIASLLKPSDAFSLLISSASRSMFADSGGNMFSVQFSIEDESTFLAQRMYQEGFRRVVLLFVDNDFSRTHEKSFTSAFQGKVLDTLTYSTGDISGLRSLLLKVKQMQPDALFIPEVSPLLLGVNRELRNMGLEKLQVFSVYAAQSPDVIEANGDAIEGLAISYPDIGTEDALIYYPKLGARLISEAAQACGEDSACVKLFLKRKYTFDSFGVLNSKFGLKKVVNKQYISWE